MGWSPAILGTVQGQNKKIVLALNTSLCVCEREKKKTSGEQKEIRE